MYFWNMTHLKVRSVSTRYEKFLKSWDVGEIIKTSSFSPGYFEKQEAYSCYNMRYWLYWEVFFSAQTHTSWKKSQCFTFLPAGFHFTIQSYHYKPPKYTCSGFHLWTALHWFQLNSKIDTPGSFLEFNIWPLI